MRITPLAIVTFFFSYWATRIYQLGEVDGPELSFFPFSDQLLTLRTWLWFAGDKLSKVILLHGIYLITPSYFWFFGLIFWLEYMELIDFLLHYNEELIEFRYFYWTLLEFEFGDFKLFIITIACVALFRNGRGNHQRGS